MRPEHTLTPKQLVRLSELLCSKVFGWIDVQRLIKLTRQSDQNRDSQYQDSYQERQNRSGLRIWIDLNDQVADQENPTGAPMTKAMTIRSTKSFEAA